jgi:hypothetical protein
MAVANPLDGLAIRRRLGRRDWGAPLAFGPEGWGFEHLDGLGSVLVTCADHDGEDWVHASIAWADHMPTYGDLKHLHSAVFVGGWAYQVFAPPSDHVNIHRHALHLFGRLDGKPALPDFTEGTGSI